MSVSVSWLLFVLRGGGLIKRARNPAVEYQAMDRIHRLGQHRPVQAIKLVIEDSIESRIVQLQEKKSAMVDATVGSLPAYHPYLTLLNRNFAGSCQPMILRWAA